MGRKPVPEPLDISPTKGHNENDHFNPAPRSAPSMRSPRSPRSPFRFSTRGGQGFGDYPPMQAPDELQERRLNISSSPSTPSQAIFSQAFGRDRQAKLETRDRGQSVQERDRPSTSPVKGGFFSNYKASKSSSRLQPTDPARQIAEEPVSRDADEAAQAAKLSSSESNMKRRDASADRAIFRRPAASNSRSDLSLPESGVTDSNPTSTSTPPATSTPTVKRTKPKPFSLLNRTKSTRVDGLGLGEPTPVGTPTVVEPDRSQQVYGIRTAPLRPDHDRSFTDIMNSSVRNRSADRQPNTAGLFSKEIPGSREQRDHGRGPSALRDHGGQGFLTNLKISSSKAVHISKGFLYKVGRSGSTNEREGPADDDNYVLKVINLPIMEQTRLTRISKKLEESRDKTEFWMPAFPWRAIDYLNFRGTEEEGLYRIPGSGPQVKIWQRRFDEALDIDLFEREDLYDLNIIGSMLKAWLRELPDEIFPKSAQDRVAKQSVGAEKVPQVLIDELSNLPPFNYYLLFAITCHLSLLLAHADKNKMDFRNLCICFQPCLRIDAFCFKFLVVDWRDCWKGCKTEDEWIAKEYALFDTLPPSSGDGHGSTAVESHDERNVSSSDSSKPSSMSLENAASARAHSRSKSPNTPSLRSENCIGSSDGSSTTTILTTKENRPQRSAGEMKPLSPIQPLSPMQM